VLLDGRAVAGHVGGASCGDGAATEAQRLFSTYRLIQKWDGAAAAAAYRPGIVAAFRLRACASLASRAASPARPGHVAAAPDDGMAREAIRRTARFFETAVRTDHDPLAPDGWAAPGGAG
jgi:hypothetical protein